MKRNPKLLIILILALIIIALLIFPMGKSFTLPFSAEEVSSVVLWEVWGYKEATDAVDIAMIVDKMNDARLCGAFDFENYEPRTGDYGCVCIFYLKDGRTYEYDTMPKPGLTTIFRDADGTYYKAKNVPLNALMKKIDLEYHSGSYNKSQ